MVESSSGSEAPEVDETDDNGVASEAGLCEENQLQIQLAQATKGELAPLSAV